MFFLQFAIHFDDFAKAAEMPYIGRNRNIARKRSCFMVTFSLLRLTNVSIRIRRNYR